MQREEKELHYAERSRRQVDHQLPDRCVKCEVLLGHIDYINLCDICFEQAHRQREKKLKATKTKERARQELEELDDCPDPAA
jgi:ribosomal protein S14